MKRKILSILVGTMIILNLIGCKPTGSRFIGKWKSEGFVVTYTINKDKTWSWSVPGGLGEHGTWVFNDDWTITLIDEYGNEDIAELHTERIYDKDEEGNELYTFTYGREYLEINNTKYYKDE